MPSGTADYFDHHSQDYHPRRLRAAVRWVGRLAEPGDSLFDIGCGTGLILEAMREAGVDRLAGCDSSEPALAIARDRVGFTGHHGSILDDGFVRTLGRHRFVTMAAVLHHVVGPTRTASRALAVQATRNALSLVAPGGRLVVVEPTYEPRRAMTALFWAKRAVAGVFGNRRVELGRWNNLGAPVVAYYSPNELDEIIAEAGGRVIRRRDRTARIRRLPRLVGVRGRWFTTVMAVRIRDSSSG